MIRIAYFYSYSYSYFIKINQQTYTKYVSTAVKTVIEIIEYMDG